ncbi:uncharacterized protein [Drosophila tropicalis]|uniref:uncharacterized protein n=1 Tax=Drosophila tropicalis TaxID=46794 RepID=UPI0035ABFDF7
MPSSVGNWNGNGNANVSSSPVIVWNGAQYTASSKELELELLRREYGLDSRMLETTLVPRYKRRKPSASARNEYVKGGHLNQHYQQEQLKPSSDWILRQQDHQQIINQINFHPWLGEQKFSHFDLVPWRRTRSALDLTSIADYNSAANGPNGTGSGGLAGGGDAKSLRGLEKLELRHNRRRLQRARSTQQGLRRLVRVRLIFSIELRHKRMEILRQSALPMRVFEQRFALSETESAAYERVLKDANAGVEQHVGYFSKRQQKEQEQPYVDVLDNDDDQDDLNELVVDFASETEEGPADHEDEQEEEAQYATIAQRKTSSIKDELKIKAKGDSDIPKQGQVPCIKCRDIAIKLR